jgi:hypothetical protein
MGLADTASYVWNGLRDSWDDPYWWRERVFEYLHGPIHKHLYPGRSGAVSVMEQDWDTLIVLDGCRTDLFEEVAPLQTYDTYETVTSRGSTSRDWVRQNFVGRDFGDTVYISANPYVSQEASESFHRLVEVWLNDFDTELKTIPPDRMVSATIRAHNEYPDKRIIAHFMQPHYPFIGEKQLKFGGLPFEKGTHTDGKTPEKERPYTPWDALWMGQVSREEVWEAYASNLRLVLESVDGLLEEIRGRVVLTSDHGNMLGERTFPLPLRVYGHPEGIRNRELVDVPWATIDLGERRTIRSGETASISESDSEELEDRLEDLGYV